MIKLPESDWPDLLAKYDRPVPRYTSYPPVPAWSDDPDAARHRIHEVAAAAGTVAMYVHAPFCHSLCYYCACNRFITKSPTVADVYLEAIERELDELARRVGRSSLAALHWGGGTPNSLTSPQVDRLFRAITSRFKIRFGAEISIEVDPRAASRDQIAHFAALGFNRLSAGVQDFNAATQRAINRIQSFDQTAETIEWAREFGFHDVNIDVIYGLPHQTRQTFALTLDDVLSLEPDSVAAYAYAHVPWVNHAQRVYERALPDRCEKFGMLVDAVEIFNEAGYRFVGIDHFAAPDSELAAALEDGRIQRTFMGYTPMRASTLLAVGASAISACPDAFSQNVSEVPQYCAATRHGGLAFRGCLLSVDDVVRKAIIADLMTRGRIDRRAIIGPDGEPFDSYFAQSLAALEPLERDGFVIVRPGLIELTLLGRLFARNVAACFDAHVAPISTRHASAV